MDNLEIVVTHDAPDFIEEWENPDHYWRADVVIKGLFGVDRKVLATHFAKENPSAQVDAKSAQGEAVTRAWHELWRRVEVVRP